MAAELAFLLNLDAEHELAAPRHYRSSPAMLARIGALRPRLEALLDGDPVLELDRCEPSRRAVAWCPTPRALERIARAGLAPPRAPSLETLRRVNARSFCAALGQTLPGAAYVRGIDALREVLEPGRPYLLKRDFGFAGRERLRVEALDARALSFARRSFARGEGLQVEPVQAIERELCQHGWLCADGRLLLDAPREQHCDAHGSWSCSRPLDESVPELRETAERVARALHEAGYFGPFGVDAYRYRERTGSHLQPCSELNARLSMGYPRALLLRGLATED